jgi:CYTH domain-containing protein
MPQEIERKFLVKDDSWRPLVTSSIKIDQYYTSNLDPIQTRIRVIDGKDSFVTYKSNGSDLIRSEVEFEIPLDKALEVISTFELKPIKKTRNFIPYLDKVFTVDEFDNGLTLAELEVTEVNEIPHIPEWIGKEVTGNPLYYGGKDNEEEFLNLFFNVNTLKSLILHRMHNLASKKTSYLPLGTIHEVDIIMRNLGIKKYDKDSDPFYEENLSDLFNNVPLSIYDMKEYLIMFRGKNNESGISLERLPKNHFDSMYESGLNWDSVLKTKIF